jgi:hypothetical protein
MEIEIVTTKKKLSSAYIKQFARISINEIDGAECLGYVLNIIKDTYKAYLIKLANGEYRMLEYSWYSYGNDSPKIYKRMKRGVAQINFDTIEDTQKYIGFLKDCEKTSQIYI